MRRRGKLRPRAPRTLSPYGLRGGTLEATLRPGRGLTRRERATLEAVADRIFPPTDSPGAVQAGAVEYIVRALAGPYGNQLPLYRRGLREVERCAQTRHGVPFVALSAAAQDLLLRALEAGETPAGADGAAFFDLVREHVLEGVFCEPAYGGNRDLVGWKLVGFPGQRTGYADAYVNREVDLPPVAATEPTDRANL
jgi:gluconate 2-dehydrogenase gamma chain